MNWKTAHSINQKTFSIGAGWEAKIVSLLLLLSKNKDKKSNVEKAVLISYLEQELDKIKNAEMEALDNITALAYPYARNATLLELNGPTYPSLSIGYSSSWCQDGKNWKERVVNNIEATKSELEGLILGFDGDPIVLMGLIDDVLKKAQNEWKRLLRTEIESCYVQGARDANLMKGARYAVIENDNPCDEICAEMVGEHEVSLYGTLGIDLPPYHPNCQCVFLGVFEDNF
jgi:hypothetical protein